VSPTTKDVTLLCEGKNSRDFPVDFGRSYKTTTGTLGQPPARAPGPPGRCQALAS